MTDIIDDGLTMATTIYNNARSEMLIATDYVELTSITMDAQIKANYVAVRQALRDFTPTVMNLMATLSYEFVTREWIRDVFRQHLTANSLPIYKEFA